jgi:hypothetical protein
MAHRLTLVPGTSPPRFRLHYWDFVIDGRPLRELLEHADPADRELDRAGLGPVGENVPVLVHNWPVARLSIGEARALLGLEPSELANGRVVLYVCPSCGDLGCGAVTARVERTAQTVAWSDFGWDVGCDDDEDEIRFPGGPFVFDRDQYDAELGRFVETYDVVRATVPLAVAPEPDRRRGRWPWSR